MTDVYSERIRPKQSVLRRDLSQQARSRLFGLLALMTRNNSSSRNWLSDCSRSTAGWLVSRTFRATLATT